jgi:hypothetical protein
MNAVTREVARRLCTQLVESDGWDGAACVGNAVPTPRPAYMNVSVVPLTVSVIEDRAA